MRSFRSVILCADDFGLADGVSRGIVELAWKGRLSATGAMTNMPGWRRAAPDLKPLKDRIAVGLHLNFTVGVPLGEMPDLAADGVFPPLQILLAKALKRQLQASEIAAEIARQLDAFTQAFGAAPAFVDGHQHVHILPGIRKALIEALAARGYAGRTWLRDPADRAASVLRRPVGRSKALVVKALAKGFPGRPILRASPQIRASRASLRSISRSRSRGCSGRRSRIWGRTLSSCATRAMWTTQLRALDPVVDSRIEELNYLRSDAFWELLEQRGLRLSPEIA